MRDLDKNQQMAVDCESNVVVSAGAGAGKTTVLSERYYRLISEGNVGVENILTLTFTRKAATEMNERIYKRLLNSTNQAAMDQAAKFDKAKIFTLDSFSVQIVRNGSGRYGVASDFVSDIEGTKNIAKELALDFILGKQDNKYLKEFIYLHGFMSVYEDFFIALAVNEFNLSDPIDFPELFENQKKELKTRYCRNIDKLEKIRTDILSLSPDIGKVMVDNISLCEKLGSMEVFSKDPLTKIEGFLEVLGSIKLKKGRSKHKETPLLNEFIENWRRLLYITESVANGITSLPFLCGIFDLLEEFQNLFLTRKRTLGILTFQDISKMAVSILKEDIDLRNFYKKEFKYIMIDEFQDNNLLQKELLYLIAEEKDLASAVIPKASELEPDKLFFVGDEKQSIYRFRGADVSVFKGLSNELIKSGGKVLELDTNYRSEPDLVKYFNRVFDVVMKNANKPFESVFKALEYRNAVEGLIPEISIFYKPEQKERETYLHNDEAEAWYIVRYIEEQVANKSLLILKDGSLVPAGYKDFAILMRSTSNQIIYEKYFRKLNIPCTVQGVRALFMEAPVNDIYNFLQLLIYPGDRLSYSAILRSPFVNLSDDVSTAILLDKGSAFALNNISEFNGIKVSKDDIDKYNNARDLYIRLVENVDFIPISEIISVIWHEGGYRHFLMSNCEYHGYLEYYDYLKTLASSFDERGDCLAVFLDLLRDNLGKYKRLPDLELLKDVTEGVQILTIHRSKGLEFPVVILANTGNAGRKGASTPYYISDDFGITLKYESSSGEKANYFYDHAKKLEAEKDLAENKRILYVAMTRVQSHLIISGGHNRNSINMESETGKKVLLNMVLKGLGWNGDPDSILSGILKDYVKIIPDITEDEIMSVAGSSTRINTDLIKLDYENCETIVRIARPDTWSVSELNSLYAGTVYSGIRELSPIDSDNFLTEKQYGAFGTYCHKIIEANLKKSRNKVLLPSSFSNFKESQKKILEMDAQNLASNFLKSEFRSKLKNSPFNSELTFLFKIGDLPTSLYVNGQIDLLVEKEDKIIIVDFKTDKFINSQEYGMQLFLYRKATEEIYNKPAISYLFYLREGSLIEVDTIFSLDDVIAKVMIIS